jgi:hypothetical protein
MSEDNLITEGMVKKATYLIHKLADRRGEDFAEIQKKCKKKFGYTNLAKVTLSEGHALIDKLIELTGGEEQQQGARVTDDGAPHLPTKPDDGIPKHQTAIPALPSTEDLETEIGHLAHMLQICVHDSKEIFKLEFGKENITEGTRAMLVKSFAATIFIEAGKRGIGR